MASLPARKGDGGKGGCLWAAAKILLLICTSGSSTIQMSWRLKGWVMPFAKAESCSPLLLQRDKAAAKPPREAAASPLRFCAWSQRGTVASQLKGRGAQPALCFMQHPLARSPRAARAPSSAGEQPRARLWVSHESRQHAAGQFQSYCSPAFGGEHRNLPGTEEKIFFLL